MKQAEIVVDCHNVLGEGVLWNAAAGQLHWVDIESSELWTLNPVSGEVSAHKTPERATCLAPRHVGGFVVAFAGGFAFYDPATGAREDLAAFEPDQTTTRLNDGRTDRQGRLVAGGYDEKNGTFISSVVGSMRTAGSRSCSTGSHARTASASAPMAARCISRTRRRGRCGPLTTTSNPAPSATGVN